MILTNLQPYPTHRCEQSGQLEPYPSAHCISSGQDRDDQGAPELPRDGHNRRVDLRPDGPRAGQEEQEAGDPARLQ